MSRACPYRSRPHRATPPDIDAELCQIRLELRQAVGRWLLLVESRVPRGCRSPWTDAPTALAQQLEETLDGLAEQLAAGVELAPAPQSPLPPSRPFRPGDPF